MWLVQTIAENVSNLVAFSLALHNSNADLTMRDFMAAFTPEKKRSLREAIAEKRNKK